MIQRTTANKLSTEKIRQIKFVLKLLSFGAILFCMHYFHTKLVGEGIPLHFIKAISLYLYADLLISLVRLLMVFFYVRKHVLKRGVKNNFELGINHIANILHSIILIASVLLLFEIDPINLITSLSIVAAAIAILSKDYISNMINGMIIMFADELTIGDEIKIGDIKGKIVDITLINVHIVNDDEDLIYIPNSIIFSSQIMNFTKRSVRKVSFDFDMKNERLKNIVELEKYITTSLTAYQQYIKEDSYSLKIIKINENFSALKFQFILHKQSSVREKDLRRIALRNVLNYEGK
ncbi:MAG: small-conductance mechanosensitive channel [Marivirga sp.]|jgi:small-conductance mechanosensitive channel